MNTIEVKGLSLETPVFFRFIFMFEKIKLNQPIQNSFSKIKNRGDHSKVYRPTYPSWKFEVIWWNIGLASPENVFFYAAAPLLVSFVLHDVQCHLAA